MKTTLIFPFVLGAKQLLRNLREIVQKRPLIARKIPLKPLLTCALVLLPAVQAALTDANTALATSTWAFVRSFGLIWGATIQAAVFNTRFAALQNIITDPAVVAQLSEGQAYERATKVFLDTITDTVVRSEVILVFSKTLKTIWYVSIALEALGFVLVNFEKEVPLRKELDTEYGIVENKKSDVEYQPRSEGDTMVENKTSDEESQPVSEV